MLALSATRNHDKVGLVLFTDQIELYIHAKKGHRHVLRVVREILFFKPVHRGTDITQALEFANRMSGRAFGAVPDFPISRLPESVLKARSAAAPTH